MNPITARLVAAPPQITLDDGWNTDLGNARILLATTNGEARYDAVNRIWRLWDGRRFVEDDTNEIYNLATMVPDWLFWNATDPMAAARIIQQQNNTQAIIELEKWSKTCRSRGRITAMVEVAAMHDDIQMPPRLFNADPNLLNTADSIYHLTSNLDFPHDVKHNMTRVSHAGIGDASLAVNWLDTLQQALRKQDLIDYFQRAAGYTLTGHVTEQCFFFLHGRGLNGKSTIINTLAYVLGDYARKINIDSISADGNNTYELAELDGLRMIYTSETEQGNHLAESLIKDITGGDPISVRRPYGFPYVIQPQGKIWIAGNHKPRIRGTDDGIWRRVHLIPFINQIKNPDPDMPEKLKLEADHIMAWALDGAKAWQAGGLQPPAVVTQARDQYRREQDVIGEFWADCIYHPDPFLTTTLHKDIYTAYRQWCVDNQEKPITVKGLAALFDERDVERRKGSPLGWRDLVLSNHGLDCLQRGQVAGF